MRKPFIAGNWKLHTSTAEVESILTELKQLVGDFENADMAVCPPYPYLAKAVETVHNTRIQIGAQNMYWEDKGAFTGEVAGAMLKDIGCSLVILGHSERRHIFGETDANVIRKVRKALEVGLKPIACVGETLEEREAGRTEAVVGGQIEGSLGALTVDEMAQTTVAYEPVWAIGTGKTATPEQAQEVHGFIRQWLENRFGRDISSTVRIQYGGSVKPENAADLLAQPDIDGALVGGASLKAESFAAIIRAAQ